MLIVHRECIDELEKEGVLAGVQTILVVDSSPDLPYRDISELLSQETKHAFLDELEGDDLCVMS